MLWHGLCRPSGKGQIPMGSPLASWVQEDSRTMRVPPRVPQALQAARGHSGPPAAALAPVPAQPRCVLLRAIEQPRNGAFRVVAMATRNHSLALVPARD